MKRIIIATTILAMMALAAFAGYDYAIRTASVSGYYIEDNTLVCYDITYGDGTTYHYGD